MKKFVSVLMIIGMIAALMLTAACGNNTVEKKSPASVLETEEPATEAAADTPTEAPVETTAEPPTAEPLATVDPDQVSDSAHYYKTELINNNWYLKEVYADGQRLTGNYYYGSIVRQTGAYIDFFEDDTFKCILGYTGCEGTYTLESGDVNLHITKVYSATGEPAETDLYEPLTWNRPEGTVEFRLNSVVNVFAKRSQ